RDSVMKAFRGRQIQMLVATDVAARGIDVDDVTHVINYQLPDEIETYNHRSGRTGRAGKTGTSIVIITKSELRKIQQIERNLKTKFIEKSIPTGMEICEVQLIHLANKVKNAEVANEIDQYLPQINELLGDLSKEDLIRKMFAIEFNRFVEYYKKNNTIESPKASKREKGDVSINPDGSVRYFLNLGARDNFDWMSLKDFLRETLDLGRDDLYKVDVKEGFSFFNTDAEHSDKVMEILNNINHEGRRVNVEISTSGGSGRSSSRRDHNNRKGERNERAYSRRSNEVKERGGVERRFGRRREDDRPLKNERS